MWTALRVLHARNVIFRDMKPSNILLDARTCRAVLTDFGCAKVVARPGDQAHTLCGSVAYQAPEILKRKGYGPGVDSCLWIDMMGLGFPVSGFGPAGNRFADSSSG